MLGWRSALEAMEPFRPALLVFLRMFPSQQDLWGGSGRPFFSPPCTCMPPLNRRPRRAPRLGRALEAAAGRFRPMGYDNCPLLTNSAEAGISVGRGGTFPAAGFFILASYRIPTLVQHECGAASAAPSFLQTSHAEVEIGAGGTFPA